MATVSTPLDQIVVLHDVSWQTYLSLLDDLADSSAPRLAYYRGRLTIMSPTGEHEELNRTLSLLVEVAAEEMGVNIRNLGSMTFKLEELERGFEPDSCFYVKNVAAVKGKRRIDLAHDPPPDLLIEIDITSSTLKKDPFYAEIGVPEIWRYVGNELRISRLEGGAHVSVDRSVEFPLLTARVLSEFLAKSWSTERLELLKTFRKLLRDERA